MQNPDVSTLTERILKHLGDNWEALPLPSRDALKNIILTGLQTSPYEAVMLKNLADYMISTMNLHLWNMVAILRENAEQEGISAEDCEETLKDVLPKMTRLMEDIRNRLSIQTLDDLATLVNITANLQILSQSDFADDAQDWLYGLPELYHGRLQHEQLLRDVPVHRGNYRTYPRSSEYWQSPRGYEDDKYVAARGVRKTSTSLPLPSNVYVQTSLNPAISPIPIKAYHTFGRITKYGTGSVH